MRAGIGALAFAASFGVAACGHDEPWREPGDAPRHGFDDAARAELTAAGVDKYFDRFEPEKALTYSDFDAYVFTPRDDGPTCMYGSPFRVSVRDVGAEDLLIYLQGGGACWSDLCAANEDASMGVQPIGWTDADPDRNPTLSQMNVVFVAYCDGSVFSGDNLIRDESGKVVRRHRGLANLSAALDVARSRFPHPRRVVLSGSSAGGYGTILGTAVVRMAYPGVQLFVMNDAGPGVTNPENPSLMNGVVNDWKATQFVPASCQDCFAGGQFTGIVSWGLEHDPTLRVSIFSARQDAIIGGAFLKMTGVEFEKVLLSETDKLHAAHPDRFQRFFWQGAAHTAIMAGYYDLEIDGTTLLEYVDAMLEERAEWRDLVE